MNHDQIIKFSFLEENECDEIISYAENKKKILVKSKSNQSFDVHVRDSIYEETQITTASYGQYNFLIDNPKYINRFLTFIDKFLPNIEYPIAVQSWVNIYEKNQGIGIHNHSGLMGHSYSANIFLGGPKKPGITYYTATERETFENVRGEMHIFNCPVWHSVCKNNSDEKRYSIGMTFHSYEAITKGILSKACWNNSPSIILLEKL